LSCSNGICRVHWNRALSGQSCNSMHDMQVIRSRINTDDCAYR
jgi:hypothetical protein